MRFRENSSDSGGIGRFFPSPRSSPAGASAGKNPPFYLQFPGNGSIRIFVIPIGETPLCCNTGNPCSVLPRKRTA